MAKIRRSYLALIIVSASLPVLFNACGPNGLHSLDGAEFSSTLTAQEKFCQAELINDYSNTYHPILKTNCNKCHSNAHGSNDVRLSFKVFQQKGQALIDYQATHPHGGNSINLSSQIAAVQAPWSEAMANYSNCLTENPDENAGSGIPLNVKEKPLTAIAGMSGAFKSYSWNLSTDSDDRPREIQATFTIEARLYEYDGKVVGFEFKNPSLQLAANQAAIELDGLKFTVMGQVQDGTTTYSRITARISGTSKTFIAPGLSNALVYFPEASAATRVGFQFLHLK